MNRRQHAMYAARLIEACGGLVEAGAACRVGKSSLSTYQDPNVAGAFMPADVIADLETYCGEAIYSRALFEARPSATQARDMVAEASEATESVAELQKAVRLASVDGVVTPRERARLGRLAAQAQEQLREVAEVIGGDAA